MGLPDAVRIKHGVIVGGTGAGKSTFLENIIAQDLTRRFGARKMSMIIFDGKANVSFWITFCRISPPPDACRTCGFSTRRIPLNPAATTLLLARRRVPGARDFIFRSFGLREDFFKGHQEAYLSDLVRVLQYTGKLFNVYDVLVMALDEDVLQDRSKRPRRASRRSLAFQCRSV